LTHTKKKQREILLAWNCYWNAGHCASCLGSRNQV